MQKQKKNKKLSAICTILETILSLHFINNAVFFLASLHGNLDKNNGTYFKWRYGNVYYKKQGTGSPLLLIHDLDVCSSAYEWNKVVRSLSESYTVYTIDLIGCGRSDKPKLTYTSYFYVQLLSDFISQIIKQKTNVAATGLSASFVTMACNANPDLFGKLIFINPCDIAELSQAPDRYSRMWKLLLETPVLGTLLYNICVSKNRISMLFSQKYFSNSKACSSKHICAYHEAAHLNGSDAKYLLASLRGHFVNISPMHVLHKITNPVLFIAGGRITDSSSIAEAYCRQNDTFSKVIIDDAKMLPQLEKPTTFLSKINQFL